MTLVIDGNVLLMTSLMVWRKNRRIPVSYFILLQVFKYVKQFKPDKIFIAADGGCFAKGSKILMSDFTEKNIEDVNIGDTIISFDEKAQPNHPRYIRIAKVLRKINHGVKEIVEVKGHNRKVKCTPEHKFFCTKHNKTSWKSAKALLTSKVYQIPNDFSIKSKSEYNIGYISGFLDSDGCKTKYTTWGKYVTNRITFSQKEKAKLIELRKIIKNTLDVNTRDPIFANRVYNIYIDRQADTYRIIKAIKYSENLDYAKGYLAGFFIGDGTIDPRNRISYIQSHKVNSHKIKLVKHYLNKLHIPFNVHIQNIEKGITRINVSSIFTLKVPIIYGRLKREKYINQLFNNISTCTIPTNLVTIIDPRHKEEVYDLETTSGTYICNNFLVHNSSWRKAIYPEYKANRKGFRDSFPDIDWNQVFADYTTLLQNIQSFTPITVVHIPHIEGDDVISYVCRYYQNETVVVSKDHDIQQLLALPHVSLWLVRPKNKSELLKGEAGDILDDKIKNGDVSDNIPKAESFSEAVRNEVLVDLFNLPKTIELTIKNHIDSVKKSEEDGTFLSIYKFKFLNQVYPLLVKKEEVR